MENVNIQTSQNVEILHQLAGVGNRILASILDNLFLGAYVILMLALIGAMRASSPALFAIILTLPFLIYHFVCELFLNGQSLGKKLMKIRVVMLDGSQPAFMAYFIRWILRLVDTGISMGSVAIISIVFSKHGQRLGDIAAGTTVIRVAPNVTLDHLLVNVSSNHTVSIPEATNLKESDIQTLREVIHFYRASDRSAKSCSILNKARKNIETKLGITSSLSDADFVNTVLKDYNSSVM